MDQDEIKALAVKLAAVTDLLEQRSQKAVQQTAEAAQFIGQSAQHAAAASEQLTAHALAEFKRTAAGVLVEGLRQPMEEAGRTIQQGASHMQSATSELEQRLRTIHKAYLANAWKVFIASAVASIAVIAVAIYIGLRTHQDMARSEWISQLNAAVANGKLAPCSNGGLCAHVGKQWVRLDQSE